MKKTKPIADKRNYIMTCQLTPEEFNTVKSLAKSHNITVSNYLRAKALNYEIIQTNSRIKTLIDPKGKPHEYLIKNTGLVVVPNEKKEVCRK